DLRPGCGAARLVDDLWPDAQPENPGKALQILVSRLRGQIGSDVVLSTPTGYRLALDEQQVDSAAIVLHAAACAQFARAGDHTAALREAEAGLALWEGTREDGSLALDDPLGALRASRASTHHALVRAQALALSRLGRHDQAVDAL